MVRLIIFDWDDVFVVGAARGYFACYRKALADFGVRFGEAELERIVWSMWGQPHQQIIQELISQHSGLRLADVVEKYREYKAGDTFFGQLKFIDGGQEFLRRISKSYTLAIATSQQRSVLLERLFPMFEVPDVFKVIISSHDLDDPNKAKPHPHMIQQILKTLEISAKEAVMVGDAKNDVLMAQSAGVEPIVVLTGHLNRQQAEELGVKHIIRDVTALEFELKRMSTA